MDTIKIEDGEYPFVSGRGALRLYARKKEQSEIGNKEFVELLGKLSMDDGDLLNYCCFVAGCSANGTEFPYSFEEFQDILTKQPHIVDQIDNLADQQAPPDTGRQGKG